MLNVTIGNDQDVESPLEMSDWKLHSFGRRHINYTDPDTLGIRDRDSWGEPQRVPIGLRRKLDCGTAFWCYYYEHGDRLWGLMGQAKPGVEFRWDGVRYAGLLVYEGNLKWLPKDYQKRAECAASWLDTYTDWCNGHVYYYCVMDEEDCIDSCGGFYGTDRLCEAIAESVGGKSWVLESEWSFLRRDIESYISKETANV
jgi:hypothetical protein